MAGIPREPEQKGVPAETEMVQKDVRAETETVQRDVHTGMARGTVLAEIREHVFRAAARQAVFRESVPARGRAAARATVPSGTATGTATVTGITAASLLAAASAAQGVQAPRGMTGILCQRLW